MRGGSRESHPTARRENWGRVGLGSEGTFKRGPHPNVLFREDGDHVSIITIFHQERGGDGGARGMRYNPGLQATERGGRAEGKIMALHMMV